MREIRVNLSLTDLPRRASALEDDLVQWPVEGVIVIRFRASNRQLAGCRSSVGSLSIPFRCSAPILVQSAKRIG